MTTEIYPCPRGPKGRHKFGNLPATGSTCSLCQYTTGGPPPVGLAVYLAKVAELELEKERALNGGQEGA